MNFIESDSEVDRYGESDWSEISDSGQDLLF